MSQGIGIFKNLGSVSKVGVSHFFSLAELGDELSVRFDLTDFAPM